MVDTTSQKVSEDPRYFRKQGLLARFRITPWRLKWLMMLYPPLFANGVRAKKISADYRDVEVRLGKTLFNTNFNGSIFGGTIAAAFDPWYGVMFWQILNHKGMHCLVVNLGMNVHFKKPALSSLTMHFHIPEEDVATAIAALHERGKYVKEYTASALDKWGDLAATADVVVHMRIKQGAGKPKVSF
jgi:hypothetical protein